MIITCPVCSHTHDLDSHLLGSVGRRVACPKCDEIWFVSSQNSNPAGVVSRHEAPEIVAEVRSERSQAPSYDELYASNRPAFAPDATPTRRTIMPRLLLAVIVAGAIGSSVIAARAKIVSHVPLLGGAYAAIGLPVNLRGLELRHVRTLIIQEGERSTLAVEGEIANIRKVETAVPALQVTVRDGQNSELYHWSTPAPKPKLQVGEMVLFRARLSAPPGAANHVIVEFVESGAKEPTNATKTAK